MPILVRQITALGSPIISGIATCSRSEQSGLLGGSNSARGPLGHAKVSVDFRNMPRGVRTKATASGLFEEVTPTGAGRCHWRVRNS